MTGVQTCALPISDHFSGVSQVTGSAFADTFVGGTAFVSPGYSGSESFRGLAGNDSIDGGSGFDSSRYDTDGAISTGIAVDMANGIVVGDPVLTGTDTLRSVEGIRGSWLADTYSAIGFSANSLNAGSSGTYNEFEGMGGDDTIIGNGNTRV